MTQSSGSNSWPAGDFVNHWLEAQGLTWAQGNGLALAKQIQDILDEHEPLSYDPE